MPLLTRLYIKASFVFLALALLSGALIAGGRIWSTSSWIAALSPVYFHLFLVGWVTELIFGVAYWMFPKFSREKYHGSPFLSWGTFLLLNLGLVLGEPWITISAVPAAKIIVFTSAVLQLIAGVFFVINTWTRVKLR
jgi:hypothetical protein